MKMDIFAKVLLVAAVVCLAKIAFVPTAKTEGLVSQAYAEGGVIELKNATRIVTSNGDGAATYVWDYEGKTKVRKYWIEGDSLKLKTYYLEKSKP